MTHGLKQRLKLKLNVPCSGDRPPELLQCSTELSGASGHHSMKDHGVLRDVDINHTNINQGRVMFPASPQDGCVEAVARADVNIDHSSGEGQKPRAKYLKISSVSEINIILIITVKCQGMN